jgi:hypothetical protein
LTAASINGDRHRIDEQAATLYLTASPVTRAALGWKRREKCNASHERAIQAFQQWLGLGTSKMSKALIANTGKRRLNGRQKGEFFKDIGYRVTIWS